MDFCDMFYAVFQREKFFTIKTMNESSPLLFRPI